VDVAGPAVAELVAAVMLAKHGVGPVGYLPTVYYRAVSGHPMEQIHRRALRPGRKRYSAPRTRTNAGRPFSLRRTGLAGNVKDDSDSSLLPLSGFFIGARADEVAVVDPHLLDELELPAEAGTHEDEDDSSFHAIVLQDPSGSTGP
jgi:hypothetical protein